MLFLPPIYEYGAGFYAKEPNKSRLCLGRFRPVKRYCSEFVLDGGTAVAINKAGTFSSPFDDAYFLAFFPSLPLYHGLENTG